MKNRKRGYTLIAILLIVFSVIAFVIPFIKTTTFFVAYTFGIMAILYQIYIFKISFNGSVSAKSKFYGFPIARIGVVYLVVQLVVSIIEMGVSIIMPSWIGIIINVVLLSIVIIGCIAADAMKEEILNQDDKLKHSVSNMRTLQSLSATLASQCDDLELKKILQKLADEFKYSDPVSTENTVKMEQNLIQEIGDVQGALADGDYKSINSLCKKIMADLTERNRVCARGK